MLGVSFLSITVLAQLWGTQGVHDDDCELAHLIHGETIVDWKEFRETIGRRERQTLEPLVPRLFDDAERAQNECPLGYAVACLLRASYTSAFACVADFSLQQMLASRWPIMEILAGIQAGVQGEFDDSRSCDDHTHPSIDWAEFREYTHAFAKAIPPWLSGESESEAIPDEFNEALGTAQGIVWKGSSAAVANGRSISEWTGDCELGLLAASAVRAAGVVLSDGDVYRIGQRAIEGLQSVFRFMEEVMRSPWPLFGLLHVLSVLKRTLHDTRLLPGDLPSLAGGETWEKTQQSPVWQATASVMQRAGAHDNLVMLTALPRHRVDFLQPFLKRASTLGILSHIVVAPLLENMTETCEFISQSFLESKNPDVQDDWSPCLPFVSQFPERAQFLFIHVAMQLSLTVLWFDFHVFWVQSPLPWLKHAMGESSAQLSYHDPCVNKCSPAPADVLAVDDFYSAHWPKPSLLLLRPSSGTRMWVDLLLRWICTYPYGSAKRGFHYLLHPDKPDAVPSMSMLPDANGVRQQAPITLGELDAEQRFVSTDGWFGRIEEVISFEIGLYIAEADRHNLLNKMFSGVEEEIFKAVYSGQKFSSPLRPTQRLLARGVAASQDLDIGAEPEVCSWHHVAGAYLGGYAADSADSVFSQQLAQCECSALGLECRGITCEPGTELAGESKDESLACTLRRGDPWLTASPHGESTYVKVCESGGCDAPEILHIVHVNFADGCCEAEQKQSSETALQFGADESRPLRGNFLDEDFKQRNHALLTFNRTPELTQHKTPSGKIGYYVWKAYVVLKTLEDPDLPWDTTAVAWTDAGIHFVDDMRPLIRKYLRTSDVAATRTPMLEGDFSKRDAFILLDADYQTIIETNQVATGFILVRKTQLAINFLRQWLRACEDPRIMTEEPSILGAPDYFTFKNNNDDQTAFSLLFKKHGFHAFSVGERDSVVYTGRNLAKFIKASDDFAVGRESTREDYLKAADEAAGKAKPSES